MTSKLPRIAMAVVLVAAGSAGAQSLVNPIAPAQAAVALPVLEPGWLVTAEEAKAYGGQDGFNEPIKRRTRAIAIAPLIEIVAPEPVNDLRVKAPFAIAVLFKSLPDAVVNPASFKVLYGAFKIDITSRITQYVKVTKDGFSLADAKIPSGSHRLTLQVQDEKQRMAERELRLVVE